MKVSDYVFGYLKERGSEKVFLVCGGGCMHLADSLGRSGMGYVPCLHEQGAAVAAIGYSQYREEMGVVLVTTGPGGTNTLTGVAGAWADSMPLLVISGQVKRSDMSGDTGVRMLGFQEVDIVSMAKPVTKYAVTVKDPESIRYHMERAVHEANSGRKGPVWLDIPLDVQASQIEPEKLVGYEEVQEREEREVRAGKERKSGEREESWEQMKEAAQKTCELLKESKRPVILAGYGIRLGGAYEEFMEAAVALDIPVLTTWKAIDFLEEEHPLYYGRPGSTGQRGANFMLQNSDLVLSLGARLDYGQIGYEHKYFARGAKKIVVERDPSELGKLGFSVDLPVLGEIKEFLKSLLEEKPGAVECEAWKERGREWNRRYPVITEEAYRQEEGEGMSAYAFVDQLSKKVTEDCVYAPCCSGVGVEMFLQSLRIGKGVRAVVNCPGLGAMGFDIPNALGVGLASGKTTVCVAGDGGFQMNIQELETIRRLKLRVKFFVLNNGGYGSITNMQRNYFGGYYVGSNEESGLSLPSLKRIAEAYGYHYSRIERTEELGEGIRRVLREGECSICEVMVKKEEKASPKVSSSLGRDGRMHSRPLEDLWPFLPREEFRENMIIEPVEE